MTVCCIWTPGHSSGSFYLLGCPGERSSAQCRCSVRQSLSLSPTIKARKPRLGASQPEDHARSQADVLELNLDRLFTLRAVLFQQLSESSITAESLAMPRQRYIFLCIKKFFAVLWCLCPHPVAWPQGQGRAQVGATK